MRPELPQRGRVSHCSRIPVQVKTRLVPAEGGSLVTFYRCDLHGEGSGTGIGLSTAESAVCTPFIDGRIVTRLRHDASL
jgi:hypothetical protein